MPSRARYNRGRTWSTPKISRGQNVQLNGGGGRYAGSIIWALPFLWLADGGRKNVGNAVKGQNIGASGVRAGFWKARVSDLLVSEHQQQRHVFVFLYFCFELYHGRVLFEWWRCKRSLAQQSQAASISAPTPEICWWNNKSQLSMLEKPPAAKKKKIFFVKFPN